MLPVNLDLRDIKLVLIFLVAFIYELSPLEYFSTSSLTFALPKRIILYSTAERWYDSCLDELWVVLTNRRSLKLLVVDLGSLLTRDRSDHLRLLAFHLM